MTNFFKARVLIWPLVLLIAAIAAGGVFLVVKGPTILSALGISTQESSSQVITSITRTEEVSLLSLGIQGIDSKKTKGKDPFFGMELPGTERATFIQYEFKAKLGFDAKHVKIKALDDNAYRVSIPQFIFIGHSDIKLELIADTSGGLSAFTPEIKQLDMANKVLSDKEQSKYIADNEETLREQAEFFYTRIVSAIEPEATLEFEFAGDPSAAADDD
ncbi:MAG: hypothetical protein WBA87_03750 [Microbacterium sp.]